MDANEYFTKLNEAIEENIALEKKIIKLEYERDNALKKAKDNDVNNYKDNTMWVLLILFSLILGSGMTLGINGCSEAYTRRTKDYPAIVTEVNRYYNENDYDDNYSCYTISSGIAITAPRGLFSVGDTVIYGNYKNGIVSWEKTLDR